MTTSLIVDALGWTLIHSLWQGLAIGAIAAVVLALLNRSSAATRYLVACSGLAAVVLSAGATFVWLLSQNLLATAASAPLLTLPLLAPAGADLLPLVVLLWSVGAGTISLRLVAGLAVLELRIRRAPVAKHWNVRVGNLAKTMGIERALRVLDTPWAPGPMVVGWLRPTLLLPTATLSGLSTDQVEALLAHELAHIRRHDYAVNLLQSVAEALLFHHPVVWWLSNRIRTEREFCCDDEAAAQQDPVDLARALVALETRRAAFPLPAAAAVGGPLTQRVHRLLGRRTESNRLASVLVVLGAVLVGGLHLSSSVDAAERDKDLVLVAENEVPGRGADTAIGTVNIDWLPGEMEPWLQLIEESAAKHGVDPEAVAIHMLVESRGHETAESPTGAVGLMQVMPATGRLIAKERGLSDYSDKDLWEPETNIDFGAWYLSQQLNRFGTDNTRESVELVAAAYNGGPRRVANWQKGEAELSKETEGYKSFIVSLWDERHESVSATFEAWEARRKTRRKTTPK